MAITQPAVRPGIHTWAAQTVVAQKPGWPCTSPADLTPDLASLDHWHSHQTNPIQAWHRNSLDLPRVSSLAKTIRARLTTGPGFCLVRGVAAEQSSELKKLAYLAIGTALGTVLENYGRLYEVTDRGVCHKKQTVPISMTSAATGFHTDSSARQVEPDVISLLCLQPGKTGGESRISNAVAVHDYLAWTAPALLQELYHPFIRDVVTPGVPKDLNRLRANAFPIFSPTSPFTFRYMRYWIETGHRRAEVPLTPKQIAALDALDAALEMPAHTQLFRLEPGDQLWVNNRRLAHDRRAYTEYDHRPRRMVRLWLKTS